MKIAYDYQIFATQKYGGISRYFHELANHLARFHPDNIDCRIISPVYVNKYLLHSSSELNITGISVPVIPRTGRIRCSINRLISPLEFRGWHPDIVHETYYSPTSVAPQGSRIVVTVYDMIHELYPQCFSVRDRTKEYKIAAVQRADHVICISENTQKDLIRLLPVTPEKTSVVHLGFALKKSDPATLPAGKKPFILYVGDRKGYKNFNRLFAAYASRPELRDNYDLVAFGGGSLRRHEIEMIERLQIPIEQVRVMSGDDGLLASLYKQASVFAYPSLYEGFGIPPLEAMSFDCPVACSHTSSIPEVVGDAAVYFDPLDTESIANALVRLSSDSAMRTSQIGHGRARLEKFSWEKSAMETLDVYKALLQ